MKLHFPNPSRSYDDTNQRVQFWGYDKSIEVTFYLELNALTLLCPELQDNEAEFLKAFDASRSQIYEVADKIYSQDQNRSYSYILSATNFETNN